MLAGTAIGVFPDLHTVADHLVQERKIFKPRRAKRKLYNKAFKVYKKIYSSIKKVNHQIADLARELDEA